MSPSEHLAMIDRKYDAGEYREESRRVRNRMSGNSKTPSDYLAMADRKYAAGQHREASRLMWKATEKVFVELADSHGLDCTEDFIALARALERDSSVPKYHYRGSLTTGKLLRDHAELDALEISELELTYKMAREFILWSCGDK